MQRLVRSLERSPARVVAQHLDQLLDVRREEALQRTLRLGVHLVLFVLLLGGRIDLLEAVRGALADGYALSRRVAAWVGVRVRGRARVRVRRALTLTLILTLTDGYALSRGVAACARDAQAPARAEDARLVHDDPLATAVLLARVRSLVHDPCLAHDAVVRGARRQQAIVEAEELEHLVRARARARARVRVRVGVTVGVRVGVRVGVGVRVTNPNPHLLDDAVGAALEVLGDDHLG